MISGYDETQRDRTHFEETPGTLLAHHQTIQQSLLAPDVSALPGVRIAPVQPVRTYAVAPGHCAISSESAATFRLRRRGIPLLMVMYSSVLGALYGFRHLSLPLLVAGIAFGVLVGTWLRCRFRC